jgi:dienelactone hydrolase
MMPSAGAPAFDYLLTRSDVIHDKIGIFGLSFGGYHAPRIAANDPRYALCAVMGANHVWGERQRSVWRMRAKTPCRITGTMCCGCSAWRTAMNS